MLLLDLVLALVNHILVVPWVCVQITCVWVVNSACGWQWDLQEATRAHWTSCRRKESGTKPSSKREPNSVDSVSRTQNPRLRENLLRIFVRGCASLAISRRKKGGWSPTDVAPTYVEESKLGCATAGQFCKRWRGAGPPFRTEMGACRALNGNGGPRIENVPGGAAAKTCGDLCRERAGRRVVNY